MQGCNEHRFWSRLRGVIGGCKMHAPQMLEEELPYTIVLKYVDKAGPLWLGARRRWSS